MYNFSYYNSTKIIFGKHTIQQLTDEIPANLRILLVYGGGSIKQHGVYDQIMLALKGREVFEFSGIEVNPVYETCLEGIKLIKEQHIDFILAAGGGSVIDASKFMALASQADGDLWDILSIGRLPETALPLGTILTLPATGTEMNGNAVITNRSLLQKNSFATPLVYPKFSILDPEITYTLPARQIANGVVDTFVHTTEQYLTFPVNAQVQDRFAESILNILVTNGEQALKTPKDYDVRANLMWASTWALNGWIGQGVPQDWATHQIGHELTAFYGLDHAQTLAIVLPGILDTLLEQKAAKLIQLGEAVFGITEGSPLERASTTVRAIESFFERMGVGTRLSNYGLGEDAVKTVTQRSKERGWVMGENRNITPEVVETILRSRL